MEKRIMYVVAMIVAVANLSVATQAFGAETSTKQVEVSSFEELMPYLKMSDVNVMMTPGTYRVTADDVRGGKFPLGIPIFVRTPS
ncbi:MAG: hypothetical protein R3Y39_08950 [Rikenellaceae bacterium]